MPYLSSYIALSSTPSMEALRENFFVALWGISMALLDLASSTLDDNATPAARTTGKFDQYLDGDAAHSGTRLEVIVVTAARIVVRQVGRSSCKCVHGVRRPDSSLRTTLDTSKASLTSPRILPHQHVIA